MLMSTLTVVVIVVAAALGDRWPRGDAGTEELRVALRRYRIFGNRLEDFSREV
ncbi:MAG: hypothetical protein ABSB01_25905 [Streptosporangiaceae bacterium]|jgi:hypothetical protein